MTLRERLQLKKDDKWVAKAGDPVIGPISNEVDAQPPLAYDKDVLKPGAGTKMQRWKKAYNKALAEDCRQSDNPTECARAYANKAVGRVETDVEPVVEKTHVIGRTVKRIIERGGAGSGHHGHSGRIGEVGGSEPGSGGGGQGPTGGSGSKDIGPFTEIDNHRHAKSAISTVLESFGVSHGKMKARYISFSDLARDGMYSVTVEELDWQAWLDADPKKITGAFPIGIIFNPKFVNVPEGTTIMGDADPEYQSVSSETIISGELEKAAKHHGGSALMLEAWDRAKKHGSLRAGIKENFNDPIAGRLIKILEETAPERLGMVSPGENWDASDLYPGEGFKKREDDDMEIRGGAGSGHHGHEGRPGEKGGSKPGKGGGGGKDPFQRGREMIGLPAGKKRKTKKAKDTGFSKPRKVYHGDKGEKPPWSGGAPESMPKVTELKGKERKKWLKKVSESNTLEQLRDKQERTSERIGRFHYDKNEEEVEYENAYLDFLTEVVMYQQFPETRDEAHLLHEGPPMTIMESTVRKSLGSLHYGRENGKKYPFLRIRGGAGSGHHGHAGREGEVGGSLPSGAAGGGSAAGAGGGGYSLGDLDADAETGDRVFLGYIRESGRHKWQLNAYGVGSAGGVQEARTKDLIDEYHKLDKDYGNQNAQMKLVSVPFDRENQHFNDVINDAKNLSNTEMHQLEKGRYRPSSLEKKLDGLRKHKFLPAGIQKKLPPLYSQDDTPDPTVWAKWFNPTGPHTWYATEYDPEEGMFFGYVDSGDPSQSELGYFSRKELAEATVTWGLPIERDQYFDPKPLSAFTEGRIVAHAGQVNIETDTSDSDRGYDTDEQDESFRLNSQTLRGEVPMDENPLKTKVNEEVMAGYVKRKNVRTKLNDVDYALIERMGDQEIIRPDRFSTITWRVMPPSQKNVRSEATRRIVERNYAQAVEDAQIAGWKAKINHYQPDEYYFVKPHDTDMGKVIFRAVLVRNEDSVDWELKALSQFATDSIAVQLPKGILRHNKEQLLKLPVIRGGPGSGHHGHKGRPGEVGGSLAKGVQTVTGDKALKAVRKGKKMTEADRQRARDAAKVWHEGKRKVQPDFGIGEMTDEEMYDLYEEIGMLEDAPDHIQYAKGKDQAPLAERLPDMDISQIASEIRKDWSKKGKGVNYAAKPYLDAMGSLGSVQDNYMFDSGESVVLYFLSNAGTWRGDTARAVKAELKKRLKANK